MEGPGSDLLPKTTHPALLAPDAAFLQCSLLEYTASDRALGVLASLILGVDSVCQALFSEPAAAFSSVSPGSTDLSCYLHFISTVVSNLRQLFQVVVRKKGLHWFSDLKGKY